MSCVGACGGVHRPTTFKKPVEVRLSADSIAVRTLASLSSPVGSPMADDLVLPLPRLQDHVQVVALLEKSEAAIGCSL